MSLPFEGGGLLIEKLYTSHPKKMILEENKSATRTYPMYVRSHGLSKYNG